MEDWRRSSKWDRIVACLLVGTIITWMAVWVVTGIWWTIFLMLPTMLVILFVAVPFANRAEGFNTQRGGRG